MAINDQSGEGPKVFRWKDRYWMISDVWQGLAVYKSDDCLKWTRQKENLLKEPGQIPTDRSKGQHADVVVSGDRAFLILFYSPRRKGRPARRSLFQSAHRDPGRRTSVNDGQITCDRDKPTRIFLSDQRSRDEKCPNKGSKP